MNKILPIPVKKAVKALENIGFEQIRQKGSNLFYDIQMEEQQ
ncbi:hypothetical protein [Methanosarcina sp. UBA411]|jgi:predicted RNA binding protein YcfA (HicA-like mRNA interferase family)|nr:hypothetical protein [Methanosarcina sp. UBA411]